MDFEWKDVIRNTVIVLAMTFVGGFIVGVIYSTQGDGSAPLPIIGLVNIVLGTLGFFISGYLSPKKRWPTLLMTVIGVWLFSWTNVLFGIPPSAIVAGFFLTGIMALIGGGLAQLVTPKSH